MSGVVSSLRVLLVALSVPALAAAESPPIGDPTTRAVLPGCREMVAGHGAATTPEAAFDKGMIGALLHLGELLRDDLAYCVPLDLPQHRVVETVAKEVTTVYPTVERQHFKGLVLEVLSHAWPCRPGGG